LASGADAPTHPAALSTGATARKTKRLFDEPTWTEFCWSRGVAQTFKLRIHAVMPVIGKRGETAFHSVGNYGPDFPGSAFGIFEATMWHVAGSGVMAQVAASGQTQCIFQGQVSHADYFYLMSSLA
jgi:hypothetical protein